MESNLEDFLRGSEQPDKERLNVLTASKESVEYDYQRFEDPGADMIPEVMFRGWDDKLGIMKLAIDFTSEEEKDRLCIVIFATLCAERATEAAFISSTWSIPPEKQQQWIDEGRPMPSEFSGKEERVVIMHFTPDGEAMHAADITRYPDKPPTLAPWVHEETGGGRMGGRFADAIHRGMRAGQMLPQEMIDYMEAEREAGRFEGIIKTLAKVAFRVSDEIDEHQKNHPSMVSGCQTCEQRRHPQRQGVAVVKFKQGDVVKLDVRKKTKGLVIDAVEKAEGNIYLIQWHRNMGPTKDAPPSWEGEHKLVKTL